MQFQFACSLLLYGMMAAVLPPVVAQSSAGAGGRTPAANARLKSADEAFRAGSAAYLRNDLRLAHAEFAKVVLLAPGVAAGHSAFGTVLLAEGDAGSAAAQLEMAHKLDPKDVDTIVHLAVAYSQLQDYGRSVRTFRLLDGAKNGALAAQDTITYAAALTATGEPDDARKLLEAAVVASPDHAGLRDALGTVLAQQTHYDEAGAQFQRAIALDPTLASAHFHLGSVLLNQHQAAAAIPELTQSSDLAKGNVAYALQLGRALRADHEDESALAVLRRALTIDRESGSAESVDAKYELALTLQANENAHDALPLFKEVVAARPRDFAALTNLGLALVQTGDAKDAISYYDRALALNAKSATLDEDLGVAYLQQSDLNHAMDQFRAGLAVEPDNAQLHYDLGLALKLKDNPVAAIPEFKQAETLDPKLPDPPYTLGVLYMQLGRFADAEVELERAIALRQDNGEAWAMLGNIYKETGEMQKAADALRRAIVLLPNQPSPHISLAAILSQQGDRAGAAAERKKAADLSRIAVSRQRADFALDTGRALLKKGQVADAVAQLQTAVDADPSYADAHSALADALERQGKTADAALERQKAKGLASSPSTRSDGAGALP